MLFYIELAIVCVASLALIAIATAASNRLLAHLDVAERQNQWLVVAACVGAFIGLWWIVGQVDLFDLLLGTNR